MTAESMTEKFEAAKLLQRNGHPSGCTFGGMSYYNAYWMEHPDCGLNHGDLCDFCGQPSTTSFRGRTVDVGGHPLGWIWSVAACDQCETEFKQCGQWIKEQNAQGTPE